MPVRKSRAAPAGRLSILPATNGARACGREPWTIALGLETACGLEDFLTSPFEPGTFDMVTTVASPHHTDEAAALPA
jgi:hypothetical protein